MRVRSAPPLEGSPIAALAVGDTILVTPDRADDPALLAHEVAHLLQQADGRVAAGSLLVEDPSLEAEADRFAARACASPLPASTAVPLRPLPPVRALVMQPKITVGDQTYAYRSSHQANYQPFDTLWAQVKLTASYLLFNPNRGQKAKLKSKLQSWASAPRNPSLFSSSVSQNRHYADFDELAKAAIGEYEARQNRAQEALLARQVYSSTHIRNQLRSLAVKVNTFHTNWQHMYPGGEDNPNQEQGRYSYYYSKTGAAIHLFGRRYRTLVEGLTKAATTSKSHKIVAALVDYSMAARDIYAEVGKELYRQQNQGQLTMAEINQAGADVVEYLFQTDNQALQHTMSDARIDEEYTDEKGREMKKGHWSVNEQSQWVRDARTNRMPLGAGPSATTLTLLALTRAVGATPAETEAAAWTIFAFWNQTAHRKRGEIHTFHEVMVVAHAYGVPYVLYQYGNVPSANHHA